MTRQPQTKRRSSWKPFTYQIKTHRLIKESTSKRFCLFSPPSAFLFPLVPPTFSSNPKKMDGAANHGGCHGVGCSLALANTMPGKLELGMGNWSHRALTSHIILKGILSLRQLQTFRGLIAPTPSSEPRASFGVLWRLRRNSFLTT